MCLEFSRILRDWNSNKGMRPYSWLLYSVEAYGFCLRRRTGFEGGSGCCVDNRPQMGGPFGMGRLPGPGQGGDRGPFQFLK